MSLVRWRAPESAFRNELENLFDTFFQQAEARSDDFVPALDVTEEKDRYVVKAELPGLTAKDVNVTVENGMLTIRGEKKQESEEKGKNFHRIERRYGSFQRVLALPTTVDAAKTEAAYKDGVLTVRLTKHEAAKPKAIEVKVTTGGQAAAAS